jgi:hypothetical protein
VTSEVGCGFRPETESFGYAPEGHEVDATVAGGQDELADRSINIGRERHRARGGRVLCLLSLVVDLGEPAGIAGDLFGLVQARGRADGGGQLVEDQGVVEGQGVDRGAGVGEGDDESGVSDFDSAPEANGGSGKEGGGLAGVPVEDLTERLDVVSS